MLFPIQMPFMSPNQHCRSITYLLLLWLYRICRCGFRGKYLRAMPPNWGAEWQAPKAGESRRQWDGVWGGVSPPQPTMGYGEHRRPPAGNAFWRVLKATERSFLYLCAEIFRGQGRGLGPSIESKEKLLFGRMKIIEVITRPNTNRIRIVPVMWCCLHICWRLLVRIALLRT